jgi:hypothetical protein
MDDFKQPKIKPFNSQDENPQPQPQEPQFVPPEQIAQEEIETIDLGIDNNDIKTTDKDTMMGKKSKFKLTKKKIIVIIAVIMAIALIGFIVYWFYIKSDTPKQEFKPASVIKKEIVKKTVSPLTGVELKDKALAKRPVTSLIIENSPDARPQSALNEAGVVVEAIAEGGVTRFLAVYQESTPSYIGPIRSARPYYIDFALGFDASFGHVGGSPDALNDIKALGVKDLDQFFNSSAYWRISERSAPHNVYSSFERLDALNTSKGYTVSKFTPLERKKDVPQTPTASSIDFVVSGSMYNPNFQYDQPSNSYKRSQAGSAHVDQKSGAQINPKVVVALVMSKGTSDGYHSSYNNIGSGKAYIFQDGIISEGTWSKTDRKSSLVLTDKNGLSMKLNAGQTWITLVGSTADVVYKP